MNDGSVVTELPAERPAERPAEPSVNRLTEARTAAGLAIADIARQLKLSPWQIEALETGDYARLPGPVFVRGFIRNYARLLKLDPTAILADIATQTQADLPAAAMAAPSGGIPFPGQRSLNWRPYAIGILIILAALAGYEFYGDDLASTGAIVVGGVNTQMLELPAPQKMAEEKPADSAPEENAKSPLAENAAIALSAQPKEAAPSPQPKEIVSSPAVVSPVDARPALVERGPNEQVVRMMFSRDSWVEIRDRQGRIIFSQLNPSGTSQSVNGQPPLRLVVGNASGVRLMLNDRVVDLAPHTQVDVARLTLE